MLSFELNVFVGSYLIRLYAAVVTTIMHDVCLIKCLGKIILCGNFWVLDLGCEFCIIVVFTGWLNCGLVLYYSFATRAYIGMLEIGM